MNKFFSTSFLIFLILSSINAFAGILQSERVDGFSHYCTYSDGGVITVGRENTCPNSNGIDKFSPSVNIENRNASPGILIGQKFNAFNIYCSYSNGSVLTVGQNEQCPNSTK